jgi:hypothetical protein
MAVQARGRAGENGASRRCLAVAKRASGGGVLPQRDQFHVGVTLVVLTVLLHSTIRWMEGLPRGNSWTSSAGSPGT